MEPLAMEEVRKVNAERGTRNAGWVGGLFAWCLAGCVGTESFLQWSEQKPSVEPCQVVAAWNPAVVSTPDPVHGKWGTPNPGLAGRIYLFGPEIAAPLLGNG